MQDQSKQSGPPKVHQTPREAAAAWLGVLLMFLVFCLPTMNGIILAYFTKQLQQDVGITIAQYGLLTGAALQALALLALTKKSLWLLGLIQLKSVRSPPHLNAHGAAVQGIQEQALVSLSHIETEH